MAIGERIRFFRKRKGLTLKELGMAMGFPEKSADVRIAQYESGSRTPKPDLLKRLADYFGILPYTLTVPDIDTEIGLLHTLFALEDMWGLVVKQTDDGICLQVDSFHGRESLSLNMMLSAWSEQAQKLKDGEVTQEEYDRWRYNYPMYDTTQNWAKIPSKELSDAIVRAMKRKK